jgi:glyoxylase-like metal-dependent hydrolase (beta-lactamase superfamily II)
VSGTGRAAKADESDATVGEVRVGDWRIVTVMTGKPWREHCYIVVDETSRKAVIVDPGGSSDVIAQEIRRGNISTCDVLLTHGHHDHVGGVASVCRDFDLTCLVSEQDARLLRQAPLYAFRFSGKKIEMPGPVEFFRTDEYRLGTHTVSIHRTPGHTRGSVVFEFPGFAMTGDTLLYQCVGRTDLPGGDAPLLRKSVGALLRQLTSTTLLFPGHGRSWAVADARKWWAEVGDTLPSLDNFRALP